MLDFLGFALVFANAAALAHGFYRSYIEGKLDELVGGYDNFFSLSFLTGIFGIIFGGAAQLFSIGTALGSEAPTFPLAFGVVCLPFVILAVILFLCILAYSFRKTKTSHLQIALALFLALQIIYSMVSSPMPIMAAGIYFMTMIGGVVPAMFILAPLLAHFLSKTASPFSKDKNNIARQTGQSLPFSPAGLAGFLIIWSFVFAAYYVLIGVYL
jgi:hypothetical protein